MTQVEPGGPPPIALVTEESGRPFWSVMIPTYRATALLEKALRSVLDQDPGPGTMQIAVVDDCSPDDEARRIVDRVAPGRVEFHRNPTNLGLAGNWNSCLVKSRGRWVHLFHQDDLVLPGFYERLGRPAIEAPEVGAAFCRYSWIDEHDGWAGDSDVERETPGIIEDWVDRIATGQRIQCPSIVVKRAVYETLGGFRGDLRYTLDWEMWVRIACRFPFWYEPEVLAFWRNHRASETGRLERLNLTVPDYDRVLKIFQGLLPEPLPRRNRLILEASRRLRWRYDLEINRLMLAGRPGSALRQVSTAYKYENYSTYLIALKFHLWWAVKVWTRRLLSKRARA